MDTRCSQVELIDDVKEPFAPLFLTGLVEERFSYLQMKAGSPVLGNQRVGRLTYAVVSESVLDIGKVSRRDDGQGRCFGAGVVNEFVSISDRQQQSFLNRRPEIGCCASLSVPVDE
jgi:hypothetical protein